jgi:hypothetical protein
MQHLIDQLFSKPFMVVLMAACFTISIMLCQARVKRESQPGYKAPDLPIR